MQQEVKLRGLDGLKGLLLLVLIGVGIFQGDLLAGQLVPLSLFTVLGYQWAYRLERQQDLPFWRHWQAVWSAWLPVLWLTAITTIGLLGLNFPLLNQSKFDLIFSPLLVENIRQLWLGGVTSLSLDAASGLKSLWYLGHGVQVAGLVALISWLLGRTSLSLLGKGMVWMVVQASLWLLVGFGAMNGSPLAYIELAFYALAFLSGVSLVYLVPVLLNQIYRLSSKYVLLMGLGLVGSLMLLTFFLSQTWTTALMGLVWTAAVPLFTTWLILSYVAGTPVLRRILEFSACVALGHRLIHYYVAYAFVTFWLVNGPFWLQVILAILLGEVLYWLLVKGLPQLYFFNGRSWISDYYALYQAMAEKNLKTWQLVGAIVIFLILFVSICVLGLLVLIQ